MQMMFLLQWLVWSGAAAAALVDAYQFSGGPLPGRGLVLGRGSASFRVVRLGGPGFGKRVVMLLMFSCTGTHPFFPYWI